jgi:hypothetical protein
MLELYRYLKLTRLVEERLVNLYRQTKVVGGVFRSLGQEATAVGTAYALAAAGFHHAVDSRSRRRARQRHSPARDLCAVHGEGVGTIRRQEISTFTSATWRKASLVQSLISAT